MGVSNKILTLVDPKIPLEKMSTMDTVLDNPSVKPEQRKDSLRDESRIYGDLFPFIQIGKYRFAYDTIRHLRLEEDSFLPSITVTVLDVNGNLNSAFFPKSDEKISIYIRSKKEQYKPIRADFLIIDATPMSSGSGEMEMHGKNKTFTISGILFVPTLWKYNIKAYKDLTSFDLFKQLAIEMQIGYATNEDSMDDKMTWINPNWNYEGFIKDTVKHIWKNDESFYRTFIDKYYYLNLINVNNQFSDEQTIDDFIFYSLTMTDYLLNDKKEIEDDTMRLLFSNFSKYRKSPMFITSYNLVSNLGSNLIENGVRRKMNYYEANLETNKYQDLFVESLVTRNMKSKKNSLKPTNDVLKDLEVHKWAGIEYDNRHMNYIYSKFHNFQNNIELNKIQLKITTLGYNPSVIRGMRIPIVIVNENSSDSVHSEEYEEKDLDGSIYQAEKQLNIKIDRFLSDYYYVDSLIVNYSKGSNQYTGDTTNFWTQMILTKREWKPIPEIGSTNPNSAV